MFEKIQKICNYLKKEPKNKEDYFNEEIITKFQIFKGWLLENGAIFDKTLDFPIKFNNSSIIGCKSKENINENESFLLIPKNLIIISKDLDYLGKYIIKIKEELSEKDLSLLYLILFLHLEKKKKDSFYKPYIDIIFIEKELMYKELTKDKLNELNDDIVIKSIEKIFDKIDEIYKLLKQCEKFSDIKEGEFKEYYFRIVSRRIKINNESALVPLLDLFYNEINLI